MEWTTRDVAADPRATRARWTRSAAETSSGSGADDGFFASWSTPVFAVAACVAALRRGADSPIVASARAARAHCFVAWTLALIVVGLVPTDVDVRRCAATARAPRPGWTLDVGRRVLERVRADVDRAAAAPVLRGRGGFLVARDG